MKIAIIALVFIVTVSGGLLNPALYPSSLYGGFSYVSPYEALRSYHRARYYARKAYDLARLRSGLYGLGNGFYGYRYTPIFPKSTRAYPPSLVSPSVYAGGGYGKTYLPPVIPSSFVTTFLPGNAYFPKSYVSSYSQNFAYGKGYSYGNKNSYTSGNSIWPYPSLVLPSSTFLSSPIPVGKTSSTFLDSGVTSYSPGYQYSYFVRGPTFSKIAQPLRAFSGYNVYGTRYSNVPIRVPLTSSKIQPLSIPPIYTGTITKNPVNYGSIYGERYVGFPNKQQIQLPKAVFGISPSSGSSFENTPKYSLLPPNQKEFSISPLSYGMYLNPANTFLTNYDTNSGNYEYPRNAVIGRVQDIDSSQELLSYGTSKSAAQNLPDGQDLSEHFSRELEIEDTDGNPAFSQYGSHKLSTEDGGSARDLSVYGSWKSRDTEGDKDILTYGSKPAKERDTEGNADLFAYSSSNIQTQKKENETKVDDLSVQ